MANYIYPTKDDVIYNKGVNLTTYSYFDNLFIYKYIREGVEVLSTKTYKQCHINYQFNSVSHEPFFKILPLRGKKLDKHNKIVCEGDVNVLNIFSPNSKVVLAWKPHCLVTLLAPMNETIGYDQDILEFNYNEDEINEYLKEQQIEKYKEEIKAAEHRKALRQVARQRLMEEGILFDDSHKRPFIPQDVVGIVYMRDGGRCCECGSTKNLQLDHIIPFSKGGSSEPDNLRLLCKECNLKKGNRI